MSFSAILTLLAECSKRSKIALMQTKSGNTDELRACILDNFSWYDKKLAATFLVCNFPKCTNYFTFFNLLTFLPPSARRIEVVEDDGDLISKLTI